MTGILFYERHGEGSITRPASEEPTGAQRRGFHLPGGAGRSLFPNELVEY